MRIRWFKARVRGAVVRRCLLAFAAAVVALPGCGDDEATLTPGVGGAGAGVVVGGGGSGAGAGATGGAGAGGVACGNGVVDPGEACDDGAESATCDSDCTVPVCGDGLRNEAAGEGCDDGNDAAEDACSPDCQPAPLLLAGGGSDEMHVVATGNDFGLLYSSTSGLTWDLYHPSGQLAASETIGTQAAVAAGAGTAPGGAGLLTWYETAWTYQGFALGGARTGSPQAFPTALMPIAEPAARAGGGYCLLDVYGHTACAPDGGSFTTGAVVFADPSDQMTSAHLLPRPPGFVASYVVHAHASGHNEFRALALGSDGGALGAETTLVASVFQGEAMGGVSLPDGGFAVVLDAWGEGVMWFPFDAGGALDVARIGTLFAPAGNSHLAAAADGRFAIVTYRAESTPDPVHGNVLSCSVWLEIFGPDAESLGEPRLLWEPPYGVCALPKDVAVNAAGDLFLALRSFDNIAGGAYALSAMVVPGVLAPSP